VSIIKYADDTVVLGLVKKDDDQEYFRCIDFVNSWCKDNFLVLNAKKTKEVVWDFRRQQQPRNPVLIDRSLVEVTDMYKYLGVTIDNVLSFSQHVKNQITKVQKRLYFLRMLKRAGVDGNIIVMFYNSTISSVLLYAIVGFYGSLTKALQSQMARPRKVCCRLVYNLDVNVLPHCNDDEYRKRVVSLATKIIGDPVHPLNFLYEMLPSGRRLRTVFCRTVRYKKTFGPQSVSFLNS